MSKVHSVLNRKVVKKNRRASGSAVNPAKTAVESKALQTVNAPPAVQTKLTEAEMLAIGHNFMCKSLGIRDRDVATVLLTQVQQLQGLLSLGDGLGGPSTALGTMFELKPENLAQGLLAVQMTGVHQAALLYMKRAALVAQGKLNSKTPDADMLMAMRLVRVFNEQLETMAKLKGKTAQQKVIVEHVNVNAGGKAIVGAVAAAKQEEQDDENQTNTGREKPRLVEERKSDR